MWIHCFRVSVAVRVRFYGRQVVCDQWQASVRVGVKVSVRVGIRMIVTVRVMDCVGIRVSVNELR